MTNFSPFYQAVRYTVFLREMSKLEYTQKETEEAILRACDDFANNRKISELFLYLIPEIITQPKTTNPSRKRKEIFEKSMAHFPVIEIDDNGVIRANEQLLEPLIQASNQIVFNYAKKNNYAIFYFKDEPFTSESKIDNEPRFEIPTLPIYPFEWIREVGVNIIACWQSPNQNSVTSNLLHLYMKDISSNELLILDPEHRYKSKQNINVFSTFKEVLSRFVIELVHSNWQPDYSLIIPSRIDYGQRDIVDDKKYNEYGVFMRIADKVNFNTLYKIKIVEKIGDKPYLTWHNPNLLNSEKELDSATLYFYPIRWTLRKTDGNLIYFALQFIPSRLIQGKKKDVYQFFQMNSSKIPESLNTLFDGCYLPLYFFRFAKQDDCAEDKTRHRNETNGYVIEQDFLLDIYKSCIEQSIKEEEIEVSKFSDTSLVTDFLGTGVNISGQFCIYRKRLKSR